MRQFLNPETESHGVTRADAARDRGITLLSSPLIGVAAAQPVKRLTLDAICKQVMSRTAAA